ncbi:MAG: CHAT domain-containing protein [bacterium]|nr:CHAT domain-containing protein [bacterium]
MRRGARVSMAIGLLTLAAGGCGSPAPESEAGGVIVEEAAVGGAAARAGLVAGDRIVGWRRAGDPARGIEPAAGKLESPLDMDRVESAASLAEVTLGVLRGGQRLEMTLPPARWRLDVRPDLAARDLADLDEARRRIAEGDVDAGLELWRQLAGRSMNGGHVHEALWLLSELTDALEDAGHSEEAAAVHEQAVGSAADDAENDLWLWERRGDGVSPAQGAAVYSAALALPGVDEAARARLLCKRCVSAYRRSLTDEAEPDCLESLDLWRSLAPGGLDEIQDEVLLAKMKRNRGEIDAAVERLTTSLDAAVELDGGSRLHAEVLSEMGIVEQYRGDLAAAQRRQRQSLEILEHLGVRDQSLGQARMGLGIVAWNRGALDLAQEQFSSALEVFEETAPETPFEAWSLQGLGLLAQERGDFDAAERFLRRSLAVNEAAAGLEDISSSLSNLGSVAASRGDLPEAIDYYQQALRISEELHPDSRNMARLLGNLGDLRARNGELEEARRLLDRSLAWNERHAAGSISHGYQLLQRGKLERQQGRLAAAEAFFVRALDIRRRLAPGSAQEAVALHALAVLRREQGRPREARELLEQAVVALDQQLVRLGGVSEDAASFAARFAPIYKELTALLLELGEEASAFEITERYRARGLLAMLGRRDLLLERDLPASLTERHRELARSYEQAQKRLASLDASADAAQVEVLAARMETLKQRRQAVAAEIMEASPRYGSLAFPEPLGVAAAAGVLDPGTLLLSYAVLPEETVLFALDAGGDLQTVTLEQGEDELRHAVEAFLYLIRSPRAEGARDGLSRRAEELYRRLMRPAAERIAAAERLLVVPDGPLHALPFAALATGSGERYLIAHKPIHTAASVTVYGQLKNQRREAAIRRPEQLVAFGDPRYSAAKAAVGKPETAAAPVLRASPLAPLPATRAEVEAVATLFPTSEVYLGVEATEERVKALDGAARVVHFALHSVVDHRFPLDSYLALSAPEGAGGENGSLQAWEVFEQLRLDADLVTLSACETGLGEEVGGEGLVGLTRAFQYAGARSIVASLWSVSDRSTSALMERFYAHLRAGRSKDEALRAAQLDLLRRPVALPRAKVAFLETPGLFLRGLLAPADAERIDASHPFHWAAFQLSGDWR